MTLRPFMSYYGGKWRRTPRYPAPAYDTIVEPFAGGAGYATRYAHHNVILCERDPRIASIWRFLIGASPADVLALPLMALDQTIDDLPACDPGGRELIRQWVHGGSTGRSSFSPMARQAYAKAGIDGPVSFWSAACRARIASQVPHIKHWLLHEGDYSDLPNATTTWFIDPPYNNRAGSAYKYRALDYTALGAWCREREGQVIVCENYGATWLPFAPLYNTTAPTGSGPKHAIEAVWCNT